VALGVVAVFAVVAAGGGPQRVPEWFLTLGLRRSDVLAGRWWQLGTHALLHGSWAHVILNALMLWMLGARIERILGRAGFFKVLAAGVLGGACGHLLLAPGAAASPLVGISGGCMALLLALTTLSPDSRMMPLPVSGRSLGRGVLLAGALLVLLDPGLGVPGLAALGRWLGVDGLMRIGHACHLGGAVAGWLYARRLLRPAPSLAQLRADRQRRERGS
jgi:membrane associated rhomboid family serine protease